MTTAGRLVRRALGAAGVDAVFGDALAALGVTPVRAEVAAAFAAAYQRLTGRAAAVHRADGALLIGGGAADGAQVTISSPADVRELPRLIAGAGRCTVQLDLDLDAPAKAAPLSEGAAAASWLEPDADVVGRVRTSDRTVVLAGPGTLTAAGIRGVHVLAAAGNLGVVNTWGAKGLFDWRSRHHWATAGLQARDVELGGLADADLVVATGLDPDESPIDRWPDLAPTVDVEPAALAALGELVSAGAASLEYPPLRTALIAVSQRGWSSEQRPLAPSRTTMTYREVLGPAGVVGADAGTAGWWVARTLPTVEPRVVHVPARDQPGMGLCCAVVAKLLEPHRPALGVIDGPLRPDVDTVLAEARRLGIGLGVEVWDPAGEALGPDDHIARCRRLAAVDGVEIATLATDEHQLDEMVEVAGPVTAWQQEAVTT